MHSVKGGWVGPVFALASSNDSEGRKSRIRRSKEDRKSMAESFIKKYQKSNDGNFPSLNLTHKEVGGSFYTVREIVREIIQENRVLAPPKLSLGEHENSEFLEQCPLGSLSMEPQTDILLSDRINTSTTSEHFHVPEPLDLNILNGRAHQFENESFLNGGKGLQENQDSDDPVLTNALPINKNKEFGQQMHVESDGSKILDIEKVEAKDLEISNVVVETFPLRPVSWKIHEVDGDSGIVHGTDGTLEEMDNNKLAFVQSSSGLVNNERYEKIPKDECENMDGNAVLKLHDSSAESSEISTNIEASVLDVGDVEEIETKDCLPDGVKVSAASEKLKLEDSTATATKYNNKKRSALPEGINPMMSRINLETWEVASKKSARPQSNQFMAFVKAFVSAFVKFWSE